ncbi:MAG: right-handed parallel beta-helix repeat-containing protein [Actinobacteria bacterium]|nr:right-handed parallel beta-helix repeat-containing protein [Actinomycetota bacterium]
MNAMIAAAPNGSTVRFPSGACLHADGTITIVGRHDLTIDGNGATFARARAAPNQFSPQWLIQSSTGVTIHSVHIEGPKPDSEGFDHAYEGQPAVDIDNSTGVTVEDSTIRRAWGDFFRVSNLSDTVRIANNQLIQAGRQGLAVVGGANIVFDHNVDANAHRFAVDLEPYGSTPVHGVRISNNELLGPSLGFICATGFDCRCARGPTLYDVTVIGNVEQS